MHDVHRDSLIYKKDRKKWEGKQDQFHSDKQEHAYSNEEADRHDHNHSHDPLNSFDQQTPYGHEHKHDEASYADHESDLHIHSHHDHEHFEDRAYKHMHEHGHYFYHSHHHNHDQKYTTLTHRILNDPARDWFGLMLMGLLITVGYFKWLPEHLSKGMIVCAAVIGIYPVLKNALFICIAKRRVNFELFVGILLLIGLCIGKFLEVALTALFLLIGSFLRLNFSWEKE